MCRNPCTMQRHDYKHCNKHGRSGICCSTDSRRLSTCATGSRQLPRNITFHQGTNRPAMNTFVTSWSYGSPAANAMMMPTLMASCVVHDSAPRMAGGAVSAKYRGLRTVIAPTPANSVPFAALFGLCARVLQCRPLTDTQAERLKCIAQETGSTATYLARSTGVQESARRNSAQTCRQRCQSSKAWLLLLAHAATLPGWQSALFALDTVSCCFAMRLCNNAIQAVHGNPRALHAPYNATCKSMHVNMTMNAHIPTSKCHA